MDPALLKQQAAFKQRAARAAEMTSKSYAPSTSTSSHTTYDAEASRKKKKKPTDPQLAAKSLSDFNYKTAQSSATAANFGTMAKIVDYMKKRHLTAQQWPLSLSEILEELQVYDINKKSEAWLQQSLPSNPRLSVDENGKFLFKPPYKVKGKNSLLALLKKHDQDSKGGVLLSDLNECIPAADKHIEALGNVVIDVPTQANKRKDRAYFYNDPDTDYFIDDEFKGLWRNASVDHLDEKKIEEYLQKHGIDTMRDLAPKRKIVGPPKRKAMKRRANQKVHNEHLSNVLEDYD